MESVCRRCVDGARRTIELMRRTYIGCATAIIEWESAQSLLRAASEDRVVTLDESNRALAELSDTRQH